MSGLPLSAQTLDGSKTLKHEISFCKFVCSGGKIPI